MTAKKKTTPKTKKASTKKKKTTKKKRASRKKQPKVKHKFMTCLYCRKEFETHKLPKGTYRKTCSEECLNKLKESVERDEKTIADNQVGRPKVVDEEVLANLEKAFAMGCSNLEACMYAKIAESTLYAYLKENPEFSKRIKLLKQNPVFMARVSVMQGIKKDHNFALKILERLKRDEFLLPQGNGVNINNNVLNNETNNNIMNIPESTQVKMLKMLSDNTTDQMMGRSSDDDEKIIEIESKEEKE